LRSLISTTCSCLNEKWHQNPPLKMTRMEAEN
jgi:hypothetical protein